jgi:hypothetical protein
MQFKCEFADEVTQRKQLGLYISCMAVIICLIYRFTLYSMRSNVQLEELIVDVSEVTTADFGVKLYIS